MREVFTHAMPCIGYARYLLSIGVRVCLSSVRLSVRHDPVLCQNGLTYRRNSFTV